MRILLGALIGGIAVFAWGYVSHMVLKTDKDAVLSLPDEAPVIAALKGSVPEPGVYLIPGRKFDLTEEQTTAWNKKYEEGPNGLLVYHPKGRKAMAPLTFATEFGSNVTAALIAALVVAGSKRGFFGRAVTVAATGLFAWLSVCVSHWAFYRFTDAFTIAEAIDQIGGWICGGVAVAIIVRPQS
jgi:hypothetical protein